jgi:hypothetical protein
VESEKGWLVQCWCMASKVQRVRNLTKGSNGSGLGPHEAPPLLIIIMYLLLLSFAFISILLIHARTLLIIYLCLN